MDQLNQFCCEAMSAWIQDIDCPLSYLPHIRSYSITAPRSLMKKNEIWPCYETNFCPYCGIRLPTDLIEERREILKDEYGINDLHDSQQKKLIPQEFNTDEWWKKRNL